jgi:KDO2-lipid IV(A) lauroyltransferase
VTRRVVLRHRVQYAGLRMAISAFGALGFRGASNLGARMGLLGRVLGIRRRVVERQIEAAFPEWTPDRVQEVAREAYESLGRTSIETAIVSRCSREEIIGMFDDDDSFRVLDDAVKQGRGVIIVAGHLGNWELSGAYMAAKGVNVEAVTRMQENPLFDEFLTRTRMRLGFKVIYDGDAVRRAPRALRSGACVAFVMDQGAAGLASTWVPFFGRLAKTPRGAATFALRLDAPVVFVVALRKPDGRFSVHFEAVPVRPSGDKNADVDRIVADCTTVLERWVRKSPGQYFWHHRRWKHQQPGTPPELGNPL